MNFAALLLDGSSFDWYHVMEMFIGGFSAFALAISIAWAVWAYFDAKREKRAETEREEIKKAISLTESKTEQRHEENKTVMTEIKGDLIQVKQKLGYFRPHRHAKKPGPLLYEDIFYADPKENGS